MSKLGKFIQAFLLILREPARLNRVIDDPEIHKTNFIRKYGREGLPFTDIESVVPDLNVTIEPFAALDGGSTPIDLALLKGLAVSIPSCHYLEIGTWRGESVANVASVAKKCITINLPAE